MPRLRWLDFFRGIAVIGMIATHVAGALLANEWKQGEVWNNLNISFGFVAPAFLLCSGVALWVAMQRRVSQQGQFGKGGGGTAATCRYDSAVRVLVANSCALPSPTDLAA